MQFARIPPSPLSARQRRCNLKGCIIRAARQGTGLSLRATSKGASLNHLRNAAVGHQPAFITTMRGAMLCFALAVTALSASAQTINLFPADAQSQWTRIAIPLQSLSATFRNGTSTQPRAPSSAMETAVTIGCASTSELGNFTFHLKWRFTPGHHRQAELQQRCLLQERRGRQHLAPGADHARTAATSLASRPLTESQRPSTCKET